MVEAKCLEYKDSIWGAATLQTLGAKGAQLDYIPKPSFAMQPFHHFPQVSKCLRAKGVFSKCTKSLALSMYTHVHCLYAR